MQMIKQGLVLGRLLRDNRRTGDDLDKLVSTRLRRVLQAAQSVPYYREIMDSEGYDPRRDFSGLRDLEIFPLTNSSCIKSRPESFIRAGEADRLENFFRDQTTGTTGVPLEVYRTRHERTIQVAKWLRFLILSGYSPLNRVMSYTAPGRVGTGQTLLQRFGIFRRRAVDYTQSPGILAKEMIEYRPHVVYGNKSSLVQVAQEIRARGISAPSPKLLIATGEVIDEPARRLCRSVFGAELTETYGSVEMGVMAYQRSGARHLELFEDSTLFEFLDESGAPARPGEPARVVVTDLHGGLMPFIRYEHGDRVIYREIRDASGGSARVIEWVIGRNNDVFKLPDGKELDFLSFNELRFGYPDIQQFRIAQRRSDDFMVEIVADPKYFRTIEPQVRRGLNALSRLPLHFEIRNVSRIAPDASGKLRFMVSGGAEPGNIN